MPFAGAATALACALETAAEIAAGVTTTTVEARATGRSELESRIVGAGAAVALRGTCTVRRTFFLATYCRGAGLTSRTRVGALPKPASSSCAITALRCAVDCPPMTVAMIRFEPRLADAVRLKPAARV